MYISLSGIESAIAHTSKPEKGLGGTKNKRACYTKGNKKWPTTKNLTPHLKIFSWDMHASHCPGSNNIEEKQPYGQNSMPQVLNQCMNERWKHIKYTSIIFYYCQGLLHGNLLITISQFLLTLYSRNLFVKPNTWQGCNIRIVGKTLQLILQAILSNAEIIYYNKVYPSMFWHAYT